MERRLRLLPVVGYYISGISITLLIVSVGRARLAAHGRSRRRCNRPSRPWCPTATAQQAINGLFDATYRIARLIGPMVAALLHLFLPVIHFLTATALGFMRLGPGAAGRARSR